MQQSIIIIIITIIITIILPKKKQHQNEKTFTAFECREETSSYRLTIVFVVILIVIPFSKIYGVILYLEARRKSVLMSPSSMDRGRGREEFCFVLFFEEVHASMS